MSFSVTIMRHGHFTHIRFLHDSGKILSFSTVFNEGRWVWCFDGVYNNVQNKPPTSSSLDDVEDIVPLQKLLELLDEHF